MLTREHLSQPPCQFYLFSLLTMMPVFFKTLNSAQALDSFGVDYIELTSPVASEKSFEDCQLICSLGLKVRLAGQLCSII